MVTVPFKGPAGGWAGHIVEMQDRVVTVSVTPAPDAIVGRYRLYVNIITASGVTRSPKNHDADMYLLFNGWCQGRPRPPRTVATPATPPEGRGHSGHAPPRPPRPRPPEAVVTPATPPRGSS